MADKTLNNLTTLAASLSTWVAAANANGVLGKIDINTLKAIIGVAANLTLGVATPSTNPGSPTGNRMWVASTPGTYTNFAGIVLAANEIAFLVDTGSTYAKVNIPIDISGFQTVGDLLNSLLIPGVESIGTVGNGYITNTGSVTTASNWNYTGFIPVTSGQIWQYKGVTTGGSAQAVVGYNASGTFVQVILGTVSSAGAYTSFTIPAGVSQIRSSARMQTGDVFSVLSSKQVSKASVEGMLALITSVDNNTTALNTFLPDTELATNLTTGFINTTGTVSAGAAWRNTDFIGVKPGQVYRYRGVTPGGQAVAVAAYDGTKSYQSALLFTVTDNTGYTNVTIPANIAYIRSSSRLNTGDVFSLTTKKVVTGLEDTPPYFVPSKVWAKQGDNLRLYPWGMVAKHPTRGGLDALFQIQQANEDFMSFTPGVSDNDTTVPFVIRKTDGTMLSAGSVVLKITHTAASPSTAQNFICLGDSTTEGISAAGIHGAWPNECSRRLTGTGTNILPGGPAVAAGSYTNIYFRGTLGDQPVKHEGRGGWGINTYLNSSTSGGYTNAFWNPGTSQFDVGYYLTQNNFNDSQTTGGVDSNGNNLTIFIQLGWNHVYTGQSLGTVSGYLTTMLDLIHTQKPGAKVKLIGMAPPPQRNMKVYSGTRSVSPESVMRDIIPYFVEWNRVANLAAYSSWVEFIDIAATYFPEESYPSSNLAIHPRSNTTQKYYTDYVHPNAAGYAQIADAVYYNILYNFCRLT